MGLAGLPSERGWHRMLAAAGACLLMSAVIPVVAALSNCRSQSGCVDHEGDARITEDLSFAASSHASARKICSLLL